MSIMKRIANKEQRGAGQQGQAMTDEACSQDGPWKGGGFPQGGGRDPEQ